MASSTPYTGSTSSSDERKRSNPSAAASDMASAAGAQIDRAMDSASTVARRGLESTREAGEMVQEVAGNMRSAVERSVDRQPMATLAMAAAVGFVLGALWKS